METGSAAEERFAARKTNMENFIWKMINGKLSEKLNDKWKIKWKIEPRKAM